MTRNFVNQVNNLLRISKRILLVEHDPVKRGNLMRFLQQDKHEVDVAKDGMTASEKIKSGTYDLFIIDKNLPYNDALTLYRSIKNNNLNTPVIFITDKKEAEEGIYTITYENFEKNFESILKMIIEQSLKAAGQNIQEEQDIYRIGNFTLDPRLRLLRYKDEKPVKLTPKESKLLKLLIAYNNKLVDKKTLQKKFGLMMKMLDLTV